MNLTMASVCFFVIVLICTQQVFADDYDDDEIYPTCDQCIRVGSLWCSEPESTHCQSSSEREDSWCKIQGPETLKRLTDIKTINVDVPDIIKIEYPSSNNTLKEIMEGIIINSSQNKAIDLTVKSNDCVDKMCTAFITVVTKKDFCTSNGTDTEYFSIEIPLKDSKKTFKYHVPCACECSSKKVENSFWCHKHGDLACGVCICHEGWTGRFCNQVKDQNPCKDRGDIKRMDGIYLDNGLNCSGNGIFDHCENCICNEDLEGAQYFSQENRCGSICQITNNCDTCILHGTVGRCINDCPFHITIQQLNESLLTEKDMFGRNVWVHCNVTVGDCDMKYRAMSKENGEMFLMVEPCKPDAAPLVNEKVSMALGIVALILLVAAAAGVVMWKHLHSVPPLPSTDMQYHNIDAEDCTGVNPLYIDPCSSFKNPMYGK